MMMVTLLILLSFFLSSNYEYHYQLLLLLLPDCRTHEHMHHRQRSMRLFIELLAKGEGRDHAREEDERGRSKDTSE